MSIRPHDHSADRLFKILRLCAMIFIPLALLTAAFDCRLTVTRYSVDAEQISSEIRIALVTDLHSCRYGKNQKNLISAVDSLSPDLILLGGDIFDDELPDQNTELFLAGIAGRYPCYYVTGNHEHRSEPREFADKMSVLEKHGVVILSGECRTVSVNGETINICGVDDPNAHPEAEWRNAFASQLERTRTVSDNGCCTVLLSHRPEHFDAYADLGFDLVLTGHAHGGQWRIPLMINGLFAPDQGFFPEYAGGLYEKSGTSMIVSRGLARESTRLPRIFNRPELVLVELQ